MTKNERSDQILDLLDTLRYEIATLRSDLAHARQLAEEFRDLASDPGSLRDALFPKILPWEER